MQEVLKVGSIFIIILICLLFCTYILLHSFSRCYMAYVDIVALMAYGVSTYVLLVCVFLNFPMANSLGSSTIFKGRKTH